MATKGWVKLAEEWNSVFWHPVKEAMLIIYVDDFKMAAKAEDHDQLWKDLKSVIDMEDEAEEERFLGCKHEDFMAKAKT